MKSFSFMDPKKQPGIFVERINLLSCEVGSVVPDAKLNYNVSVTSLMRELSEDKLKLVVVAGFDIMHEIVNPPCTFRCSFLAEYTRKPDSNMSWDEFNDAYAILHILPFVREFVSSVTLRLPFGALMLPPINANVLVDEYRSTKITSTT